MQGSLLARSGAVTGAALSALALSACAGSPEPRAHAQPAATGAPVPLQPSATAPRAGPEELARSDEPPPRIDRPAPVVCTLRAPVRPASVRFGFESGKAFALAAEVTNLELELPAGAPPKLVGLRAMAKGVELEGVAPTSDFALHPARAAVVAEIFVPERWARLEPVAATLTAVRVELELEGIAGVSSPLVFSRSCGELSLENPKFDALEAVGGHGLGEDRLLPASKPVGVSATRDGPVVAELVPAPETNVVSVLERAPGRARIGWGSGSTMIVGWISAAKLRVPKQETVEDLIGKAFDTGANTLAVLGAIGQPTGGLTCAEKIPLVAELDGERRTVGSVDAGVRMLVQGEDSGFAAVEFPDAGVWNTRGARLLVRENDLRRCKER